MFKLINYRCPECELDQEQDSDVIEEQGEDFVCYCPKCKTKMVKFNFKNNSQVYRIPRDWD
jgi:uncharacterized Zn finger protein